ncbi:OadG family protein [Marinospirillum alkaliphilum]|uniref:Probable oxaloacetate decarboxylase gamma chain n=1 Tax=Marinospirillum alkaliphilum DSM 21637 TaxID=1122209 RepID=A0A1K1W0X5_9GAMM|nr:OadG family protein [Marinospirillum alkaliphilum]SFX31072.1 oxaloacetate decarboxylase, gamma subunit [Marinospirillum alkaliphilum DSM 21637]
MQDSELMMEGFNLMLLGMGFVFVFLTVLVIATTLMSKIILQFFKGEPTPASLPATARPGALPGGQSPDLIAAITAAIHLHRQNKQQKK